MTDQTCMDVACPGKTRCTDPDCSLARANATYTAAEVKVLTETATRVAYALGRKDAGEEIAAAIENNHGWQTPAQQEALDLAARIARNVGDRNLPPQPLGDASDATSGVLGHPGVSGAVRSPQEPCGHPTCPCTSEEAR